MNIRACLILALAAIIGPSARAQSPSPVASPTDFAAFNAFLTQIGNSAAFQQFQARVAQETANAVATQKAELAALAANPAVTGAITTIRQAVQAEYASVNPASLSPGFTAKLPAIEASLTSEIAALQAAASTASTYDKAILNSLAGIAQAHLARLQAITPTPTPTP